MDTLDQQTRRLVTVALALIALVTLGWMTGIGIGFGLAASQNAEFVRKTPAWLLPALLGVLALAITAVAVILTAVIQRIRVRAQVLSEALPRLLKTD